MASLLCNTLFLLELCIKFLGSLGRISGRKRFASCLCYEDIYMVFFYTFNYSGNLKHNKMSEYSMLHKHNADEINLIVSENSKLKYEIQLDDETYKVSSPSTVFIPKGIRHKAKFISGKGIFVCIILSGKYKSSK